VPHIFGAADSKRGPAGIGYPLVLLGQTLFQQHIPNFSSERDIDHSIIVNVTHFSRAHHEFRPSEPVRPHGYLRPAGDFGREFADESRHRIVALEMHLAD
jgi:hypothetical protein